LGKTLGDTLRDGNEADLCGIIGETIAPDEIKVIFEFTFGLVNFLLHFLEHCLEVHRV
jgi:hypothetical protein